MVKKVCGQLLVTRALISKNVLVVIKGITPLKHSTIVTSLNIPMHGLIFIGIIIGNIENHL